MAAFGRRPDHCAGEHAKTSRGVQRVEDWDYNFLPLGSGGIPARSFPNPTRSSSMAPRSL
jgi:hypothetical protein